MTTDNKNDFFFDELSEPVEKPFHEDLTVRQPTTPEHQEFLPFTCLKCAVKNYVDFDQIPDNGLATKCTSCKANIDIVRDSGSKRASQLSRELYCIKCGHRLDHRIHCPSCGLMVPDYYVALNHSEARLKAKNKRAASFRQAISNLRFSRNSTVKKSFEKKREKYTPERPTGSAVVKPVFLSKAIKAALISFLVVVVIVGGIVAYRQYKAEQVFAVNYVQALYGIKLGGDGCMNACTKISEEWKANAETINFTPRVNSDDDAKADKIKSEVDKILQKLQGAPAKYSQAYEKLVELNTSYLKLDSLKRSPRGTLDNFKSSSEKASREFKQTAKDLTANLPDKLSKELESAKLRYHGLASL